MWSPDGRRIAATGAAHGDLGNQGLRQQIFVFDTVSRSGYQVGQIAASVFQLAWSPEGTAIAAVASISEDDTGDRPHGDLFMVSADGTRSLRLTTGRRVISPAWSEDGRTLAVADQLRPEALFFSRDGAPRGSIDLASLTSRPLNQLQRIAWRSGGVLLVLTADFDGESSKDQQWWAVDNALADLKP